jgi:hypothetical protein
VKRPKSPRRKENPVASKKPRIDKSPTGSDTETPVWRVSTIDTGGQWGWNNMNSVTTWNGIHSKIASFESMPWTEIYKNGSHPVPVKNLCALARKRLEELQLDDVDRLFSLRLTGKQRIWGFKERNLLKILWWDPNHEVCPSTKNHT